MKKSELVKKIKQDLPYFTPRDIDLFVDILLGVMAKGVNARSRIELRGFGAFTVKKIAKRTAYNPQTSEMIVIDEKYKVRFRASPKLLALANTNKEK